MVLTAFATPRVFQSLLNSQQQALRLPYATHLSARSMSDPSIWMSSERHGQHYKESPAAKNRMLSVGEKHVTTRSYAKAAIICVLLFTLGMFRAAPVPRASQPLFNSVDSSTVPSMCLWDAAYVRESNSLS
jgi:hypothetical protein